MKELIIIPARKGSKGIPGKNIKLLNGKPLILYTVELARQLFNDSQICVSTNCKEIKKIVEDTGLEVPFLRPDNLSTDIATTESVLHHAIDWFEKYRYKPEVLILLQPTSPFRKSEHIIESLNMFSDDLDMVVSVHKAKSNPYYVHFKEDDNGYLYKLKNESFTRRQDCPKVWEINGSIYVINVENLKKTKISSFTKNKKYVINNQLYSIDIDDSFDWLVAETIIKNKMLS
tara:strand:- start:3805 stop:4497 length:693 start_codon:yes stop_codon:yes gene_type:complete